MPINYSKGKIYKIVNDVDNMVYIGSTSLSLNKRMAYHRGTMKKHKEFIIYQHIEKYGIEHFSIILIRNYPCKSKEKLLHEERIEFDLVERNLLLNKFRPIITYEEKKMYESQNNKKYMKTSEKRKKYDQNRNEKRKLEMREYRKFNKIMQELPFYRVPITITFRNRF